ncbi:MAG: hypothetical protein ACJ8CB_25810 [Ktedonobacteraceae bacterium]
MSDKPRQYSPGEINSIFARLDPQDVERFYQSYQLWTLQQQIVGLQTQITGLQQQIAENNDRMQQAHPSAIALATLAQLQSYGVTDIDLLDRLLERGEAWLDQSMQRLAYCEQFDFIRSNNYTEWCEHALEGAYDWIDSMQNASSSPEESSIAVTSTTRAANTNSTLDEATEEILLQKLMSDEEAFMLEATLKRPAISLAQSGETASPVDTSLAADTHPDLPHISTEPASTLEQAEDVPVHEELETGQPPAEPPQLEVEQAEDVPVHEELETGQPPAELPQLEVEQPAQPQFTESTSENPEEHAQPDESKVSTPEEMIPAEFSDIPDASHVPIVQALEVEQTEHTTIAEEAAPTEVSDPSDTSHTTAEHTTEPEHAEHIPAPEEVIPFETSNPPDTPRDTAEQVAAPEQVQIEPDEQAIEVEQAGHIPAAGEFVPAERDDAHNQESTQRSNQQQLQVTKPQRKRGFLRRLIAVFFHV